MVQPLPRQHFSRFYQFLLGFLILFLSSKSFSQTSGGGISRIYTDYNGYWSSSSSSINSIKPDNDHNVLGFTWTITNTTYSTGVNDAALTAKGVVFTPEVFQAFPVKNITLTSASKIALGQLKDGVDNGASTSAPFGLPPQVSNFLTDGIQGLNIGTGVINVPSTSPLTFPFGAIINVSQIGDNTPDLLISQIGNPEASPLDRVYFINSSGVMVGNAVSINQTTYNSVGTWSSDQYEINGTLAKTSNASTNFTKIDRPIRVWAADVAAFGINQSNYTQATALVYVLGGNSDPAFLAFNTHTIQVFNANDDAASTNMGTPVDITVLSNDGPSSAIDPTSVTITTQPQHGTVSLSMGVVTYTPTAGYSGQDYFEYQVFNNGRSQSDIAQVNVTVGGPVATPVFNSGLTSIRCQGPGQSTYTATAINSTGISYSLDQAAAGTIDATTGVVTWSATFSGTAKVIATASGQGGPTSSTYTVTVNPIPSVTSTANGIICSNTAQNYVITSDVSGATFSWNRAIVAGISNPAVSNQTSSTIEENLVNTTTAPVNVVYTIIPQANGCTGATFTYTVTVNPTPVVISSSAAICNNTALNYTISSNVGNTTFSWSRATVAGISNPAANNQTSSTITETLTNTTSAPVTVTYLITPTANGCTGNTSSYTVTVNPTPSVTSTSSNNICNNTPQNYVITSDVSGATFSWSRAAVPGISNAAKSGQTSSNITESLNNTTSAPIAVVYTITPYTGSCTGQTFTYTVTVNPTISITSLGSAISCNNMAPNYTIRSNVTGATFSWSRAAVPGISNTAVSGQTSNMITEALNNVTASNISVTYVIVPYFNGCTGNPFNYRVNVSPTPSITSAPNGMACSNEAQNYSITSNINGTTFSWSRAEVTGISNAAVNDQTSSKITETLINTTSDPIDVDYTIIPEANSCTGSPSTYTVTVNPTPAVTSTSTGIICRGTAQLYNISSNVSGASFTWSRAAVTGISNAAVSGQTSRSITEALINTTSVPINVAYTIVPTANGCSGASFTYTITVNPIPTVTSTPTGVTCSGAAQAYNITSNVSSASFSWSRAAIPGISNLAVNSQITNVITENLVNTTSDPIAVAYTIIPTANGCTGTPFTYTVMVNPTPTITSASSNVICNSSAQNYIIQSNVSSASFNWNRAAIPGISNPAVNNQNSNTISETLVNTTSNPIAVAYTIIPIANGCTGTPFTYTITVNPTPVLSNVSLNQVVCSEETSAPVTLTSNVSGTTFTWTAATTAGITGFTPSGNTDIIPAQTLVNNGPTAGTITYSIKLFYNGCEGTSGTYTITVNPKPVVTSLASATICNKTAQDYLIVSNISGVTFNWSRPAVAGISNTAVSNQTTNSITEALINTTSSPIDVAYTIVPTANGCTGTPFTYTITVNPTPAVISASSGIICSNETQNYAITSNVSNATFTWSRAAVAGISNQAVTNQTTNSITEALINTTSAPIIVAYIIVPNISDCTGQPFRYEVTVNPIATITSATSATICNETAQSYSITSNVSGATFNWSRAEVPGISNPAVSNQTSNTIAETLVNTTSAPVQVTYTIIPNANSCIGSPLNYIVTVLPPTNPTFNYPSNTFCKTGTNPLPVTASSSGGTFSATPAGLVFADNHTGEINLSASTAGSYTITFVTNTTCVYSSSVNITITNGPDAAFSYNGPYCQQQSNPLPTIPQGNSAGRFSTADAGLVFADANTGEIDLQRSLPGTYTVRNDIAAANGCAATFATATVTINPLATVDAGVDRVVCAGEVISLTSSVGGGASSATWSGGTGTFADPSSLQTIYTPGPGETSATLYLTTNDPAGPCGSMMDELHITVSPIPTITSAANDKICNNAPQNYSIISNISSATFTWSRAAVTGISNDAVSGQTSNTITETLINTTTAPIEVTYTIIPIANNCAGAPYHYVVEVDPIPEILSAVSDVVCNQTTQAYLIKSNVSGTTFSWSRNAVAGISNPTVSNQTSNTINETLVNTTSSPIDVAYTIVPTANGCSGTPFTYTVTVNPTPAAPTASGTTICSGSVATLTASGSTGSYQWFDAASGGTQLSPDASFTTTNLSATTTYFVQTTVNGCISSRTPVTVTVNQIPAAPTASGTTICSGSAATLTASGSSGTYQWFDAVSGGTQLSPDASFTTTNLSATTNYYVQTTVNDCVSPRTKVVVTVNQIPNPPIALGTTICSGSTATLTASGSTGSGSTGSYQWFDAASGGTQLSPDASFTTTNLSATTTYFVQTTVNDCVSARTPVVVTVNQIPNPPTASGTIICSGSTATLTASSSAGSYQWFDAASGGTQLSPDASFTTTNLSATTTYFVQTTVNDCVSARTPVVVTVNQIPAAPAISSNSPVCSGTSLTLSTPAVAGATYYWTGPNGFTSNLQNPEIANTALTAQGTYALTITVNGCTSVAATTLVVINPTPNAPVPGNNSSICAGETLRLTASDITGAVYSWTGPNGFTSSVQNPIIDRALVFASGTYTVKATVNGCVSAAAITTVTVNPVPPAPIVSSNSPVCYGSSLNLTAKSTDGASYSWTGPNGFTSTLQNPVISAATPANSGTYYVTASTRGCSSMATSITVLVNQPLAAPVLTSNSPVCSGNPIMLTCTAYEGATYRWTGPNGFSSSVQNPVIDRATLVNQGRYIVVISTPGCSVTNTAFIDIKVNLTPLAPVATNSGPVCATQTLKLSASTIAGATYSWTGPNNFTSNLQNPEIINADVKNAGTYSVTVTVDNCTSNAGTTTVAINQPSVVSAGNNQTVCAVNPSVTLAGNINGSSTTGIWSSSGSGSFSAGNTNLKGTYIPSAADIASGTVTLTLTATNTAPCEIASSSFNVTITPTPIVSAGSDQEICRNDQVFLNGKITNGSGGMWTSSGSGIFSPSNTSLDAHYIPSAKDKITGNVTLTLTANGNCTTALDQMKVILIPPPTVNAGPDLYVMEGEKVVLQPAIVGSDLRYTWTPNLYLNNNNLKNPTLTGTQDITYTLTATSATGCIAQDQVFVKVLKPLTIPNTFTPNGDGINDTWNIKELANYPNITVKIFNRYGMQLFYSEGYGVPWDGTYNGQPLPVGTYYYIIDLKTYGKLKSGPVTIVR